MVTLILRKKREEVNCLKTVITGEAIKKIFTVNLGVKKDEQVLVFTDLIRDEEVISDAERTRRESLKDTAREVAEIGTRFCNITYIEFPSLMEHGKEPPVELWESAFGRKTVEELKRGGLLEKILNKTAAGEDVWAGESIISKLADPPQAIIALSNFSTSHTRFRDYITRCGGVRYASMPLFERSMLMGAMTADWKEVEARTNNIVEMMTGGDMIFITSHNGTSICFSMKGRDVLADTGILTEPGAFGNLPAGEAFLAPLEGTAEGVLVLEWAPTKKLRDPVELEVRNGRVVDVIGNDPFASDLKEKILNNPLIGNIAELGIGTNDKAERPDNILETEKILGTVHIALGDNSSFGGKVSVPFHEDFIFFNPTLEVFKGGQKIEIIVDGDPKF